MKYSYVRTIKWSGCAALPARDSRLPLIPAPSLLRFSATHDAKSFCGTNSESNSCQNVSVTLGLHAMQPGHLGRRRRESTGGRSANPFLKPSRTFNYALYPLIYRKRPHFCYYILTTWECGMAYLLQGEGKHFILHRSLLWLITAGVNGRVRLQCLYASNRNISEIAASAIVKGSDPKVESFQHSLYFSFENNNNHYFNISIGV